MCPLFKFRVFLHSESSHPSSRNVNVSCLGTASFIKDDTPSEMMKRKTEGKWWRLGVLPETSEGEDVWNF